MKSIATLVVNPFEPVLHKVSRERILTFLNATENSFNDLDKANKYAALRSTLATQKADYEKLVQGTQLGDQMYSTDMLVNVIDDIIKKSTILRSNIIAIFNDTKTPALKQFFPHGITGIRKVSRDAFGPILDNWTEKITKTYPTQFKSTTWAADVAALKARYIAALSSQGTEKTDVKSSVAQVNELVDGLIDTLWGLFLSVMLDNRGKNAEKVLKSYFDLAPLNYHENTSNDGLGRVSGTVLDKSNQPIPEVMVTMTDHDGQIIWKGVTDKDGKWRTSNQLIGIYNFTFTKETKKTESQQHEILDHEDTTLDTVLQDA